MITSKKPSSKIEIDLTGPDGNAYVLLGVARKLARQLNYDSNQIQNEMMSSDYENLIQVFDHYFGDFVIMYR
jgi:hypothetical protein